MSHNPRSPKIFTVTLLTSEGERSLRVRGDQRLWDAAAASGLTLPALCHQGWCLTCAGRLQGHGCVDQSQSVAYYPQDREAGFVLLCTGKPCGDLQIRTHQADEMRAHRRSHRLPAPYSWDVRKKT